MKEVFIHTETLVFLIIFSSVYIFFLFRRSAQNKIDIVDTFILSMVAIAPLSFALFPNEVTYISQKLGVEFPFVILFGILHVVSFLGLLAIVIRLKTLNTKLYSSIQEQSIALENIKEKLKNL